MATFALDEDVGGANIPPATPTEEKALLLSPTPQSEKGPGQTEQRGWEEIIPATLLKEVEEEEKQREELQLYLPPRQRTVQVSHLSHTHSHHCLSVSQSYCEDQLISSANKNNGGRSRRTTQRGSVARDRTTQRRRRGTGERASDTPETNGSSTVIRKTVRGFTNSEIRR